MEKKDGGKLTLVTILTLVAAAVPILVWITGKSSLPDMFGGQSDSGKISAEELKAGSEGEGKTQPTTTPELQVEHAVERSSIPTAIAREDGLLKTLATPVRVFPSDHLYDRVLVTTEPHTVVSMLRTTDTGLVAFPIYESEQNHTYTIVEESPLRILMANRGGMAVKDYQRDEDYPDSLVRFTTLMNIDEAWESFTAVAGFGCRRGENSYPKLWTSDHQWQDKNRLTFELVGTCEYAVVDANRVTLRTTELETCNLIGVDIDIILDQETHRAASLGASNRQCYDEPRITR